MRLGTDVFPSHAAAAQVCYVAAIVVLRPGQTIKEGEKKLTQVK